MTIVPSNPGNCDRPIGPDFDNRGGGAKEIDFENLTRLHKARLRRDRILSVKAKLAGTFEPEPDDYADMMAAEEMEEMEEIEEMEEAAAE